MTFSQTNESVVYEGPRFDVKRGVFLHSDGETVVREWIDPGNVVAVLPFDGTHFHLGYQPRELTGGYQLGLCAGKIDPGEEPLDAAKRELEEELGCKALRWELLSGFYSSEGITSEYTTLFLATQLQWRLSTDPAERVKTVSVPLHLIDAAIGAVTNAKAKIALMHLRHSQARKAALNILSHTEQAADHASWLAETAKDDGDAMLLEQLIDRAR